MKKLFKFSDELKELTMEEMIIQFEILLKNKAQIFRRHYLKSIFLQNLATEEDAYQIACIGLIKAYNNYDIKLDTCFSTYAVYMIEGELHRCFRDMLHLRRSVSDYDVKIESSQKVIYTSDDNDVTLENTLYDDNDTFEDKSLIKCMVEKCYKELSEKELLVLDLYYYKEKNQMYIADVLDVNQVYISRMLKKIHKKIRKQLERENKNMKNETKPIVKEALEYLRNNIGDRGATATLREFAKENSINFSTLYNYIRKDVEAQAQYQAIIAESNQIKLCNSTLPDNSTFIPETESAFIPAPIKTTSSIEPVFTVDDNINVNSISGRVRKTDFSIIGDKISVNGYIYSIEELNDLKEDINTIINLKRKIS